VKKTVIEEVYNKKNHTSDFGNKLCGFYLTVKRTLSVKRIVC